MSKRYIPNQVVYYLVWIKVNIQNVTYIFPVGSVEKRTKKSVLTNPKVEVALRASRQLFSTSNFIGTYHSHPYDEYFADWACPSNGDVLYSLTNKYPFEVIIAITRDGIENKPLTINFYENDGLRIFLR